MAQIEEYIPTARTELLRRGRFIPRLASASLRVGPDFLILGAQKAGTTSLFGYLAQHPQVQPALKKEIHYFDNHFHLPYAWYRAHFPLRTTMRPGQLTGEASPYYLFHPLVPERVVRCLPSVKTLVLLRDPVARAWSHYQHLRRLGREDLDFEEALDREEERLQGTVASLQRGGDRAYSEAHRSYSYLARGRYLEQLRHWWLRLPREQMLVLRSEEFYADPASALQQVLEFLGLDSSWQPAQFKEFNTGSYGALPASLRERMERHFAPLNRKLEQALGWEPGWSS